MLGNARHLHVEIETGFRLAEIAAGNRRGVLEMRGGGERDMAFAGQQAGGRVKPDPAGAGNVDLAPGMQVGEINLCAGRTVQRLDVGGQLDQIAGDEAGGKAQMAQDLHQKPAGIAAGPLERRQCLFGRLHARLHADDIADVGLQLVVQADDEVDGLLRRAVDPGEIGFEFRSDRFRLAVDRQIVAKLLGIFEWPVLGRFFDEEIKGVVDRHVGDEVDLDLQLRDRLRKDEARKVVAVGILLQVDEVRIRRNLQRMTEDFRLRMCRRFQADDLRAQDDRLVVFIMRQVIDTGLNRHKRCCFPV